MSSHEWLINIIHREISRYVSRATRRTPAMVDSYDAKTYAAKYKLLPESGDNMQAGGDTGEGANQNDSAVITGWIPLGTPKTGPMQQSGSSGAGQQANGSSQTYGWHMPPEVGEFGWLEFHEDDREAATFVASNYHDKWKPMETQPGEWQYVTKYGHTIYFKNDGSVTIKNGNKKAQSTGQAGSSDTQDSKQSTINIDTDGNVTVTAHQTATITFNAKNIVGNADNNEGKITFNAQKIVHNGNVYLGGEDAHRPAALLGTTDSAGHANTSNLATKVWAK